MNVVTQFPAARDYERDLRFRAMFEGAAIGIGICQLDGRILEANPALSGLLGYSQQELAGTHAGELYPEHRHEIGCEIGRESGREIYPDNFSPDERLLGELLRGERSSFEIEKRYRRKDGSELWGHLTVSLGRDARREPAFLIAMLFVRFAIVNPVKRLTKATHQISLAQAADLGVSGFGRNSRNELHQLAIAIDRLRRSVHIAMRKLGEERPAPAGTVTTRHER